MRPWSSAVAEEDDAEEEEEEEGGGDKEERTVGGGRIDKDRRMVIIDETIRGFMLPNLLRVGHDLSSCHDVFSEKLKIQPIFNSFHKKNTHTPVKKTKNENDNYK